METTIAQEAGLMAAFVEECVVRRYGRMGLSNLETRLAMNMTAIEFKTKYLEI